MKFEKKRASSRQNIPTSSMSDIVFILLLFFMVTTTLREVDVHVSFKLPEAESIEKIENKRLVSYMWVGNDERIQIDDNIIKLDNVREIMDQKIRDLPNIIVSLRVDKNSSMGIVNDIQEQLRKAYCLRINYSAMVKL